MKSNKYSELVGARFASFLHSERIKQQISTFDLAKEVEVDELSISKWEKNAGTMPVCTLYRIGSYFGPEAMLKLAKINSDLQLIKIHTSVKK